MSNYARFLGFEYCKFSKPILFNDKYWVSVNYFLCDKDDKNFRLHKDIPAGYRLPTKDEFLELVTNYPFKVESTKNLIKGKYHHIDYRGVDYGLKDYELEVFTFKNDLNLEVSVYSYNDGCKYGPLCLTYEGYLKYMEKYNEPTKYDEKGNEYYNPIKSDNYAWYSNECYDILYNKYYEDFDWRVPRCMILIKDEFLFDYHGNLL